MGTLKALAAAFIPSSKGWANCSFSVQIVSTMAIAVPPIAAISLMFTITAHQPANQGSLSTKTCQIPSAAKSK